MKKEQSLEIIKQNLNKIYPEEAQSVSWQIMNLLTKKIEEYKWKYLKKKKKICHLKYIFKTDMITEIKNELQRDNSSNDEFDEVKKDINSLNDNLQKT